MRPSRVLETLANNEPALVTTLHLTDPSLYEMTSLMGFDAIWMDMEHHTYSLETAATLMRAARVGASDIIARPAKGESMRMCRMLEAGATGIMVPRCESAREAAEAVRWAKYAPRGERGIDAYNPDAPYGSLPLAEYIQKANDNTFIVIQLEQAIALEQAEAIAAVDGVDILMLGPGDLSILSGIPGQFDHPLIQEAKQTIAAAAKRAGKHWGGPCGSLDDIQQMLEMGGRFICYQADIVLIKQALEQVQSACRRLGFTFDDRLSRAQ
jgi:4-hydroxy-2-oxoheptanedioate aldolase